MPRSEYLVITLVAWAIASVTQAQTLADAERDASHAVHRNNPPIATVAVQEPFSTEWRIISFYAVVDADAPTQSGRPARSYIARRISGSGHGAAREEWADEGTCPTLRGAMSWLANLPMPRPHVSGLSPDASESSGGQPANVPTDPASLRLSMHARQNDNSLATLTAAVYGGPIGTWFDRTETNLAPCWSPDRPE